MATCGLTGTDEAIPSPQENEDQKDIKAQKKKKKKPVLTINLSNCKYDSVRRVAKRFGLHVVGDEEVWTIYWTDLALPDRVNEIRPFQKVNHFPGMNEICRKDLLARNMNRMLKLFPKEYNCFPRTWTLPADFGDFQAYCQSKKNKVFIAKPGSGCQGKGIFLFRNLKDIKPGEHIVCQQYICKPFTIDTFKFDLRIYILVTSCDPLRVYAYKDGLVRLATVKYHEPTGNNMDKLCMHLTNYAINKHSKDFIRDDESGSKRRIITLNKWFQENGYDLEKIWNDIDDVIIKTLIAAHPIVRHNYRSTFPNHTRGSACFEILGFDILLDRKLKPWLMEVNRSPSFHTDAPLDKEVKEGLIYDTFNLLDLYANDQRRCMEEEKKKVRERLLCRQRSKETSIHDQDIKAKYEERLESYEKAHLGGYRRIYPLNGNENEYEKYFNQSTSLCSETAASRARADLARQLREELEAKQREMEKYNKKEPTKLVKPVDNTGSESPPREQKTSLTSQTKKMTELSASVKRRGLSFRLTSPTMSQEVDKGECVCGLTEEKDPIPQNIEDEEELERLAGLQLRDSIVRGMGVSEHFRTMLESQPSSRVQTPLPLCTRQNPAHPTNGERNVFFTQTFIQESPHNPTGPESTLSQPFLHIPHIHPPTLTAFTTPEHKRAMPGGVIPSQLPGYRRKSSLPSHLFTNVWGINNHNSQKLSSFDVLGSVQNQSFYPHYQPPSLELCGNAISLKRERKQSGQFRPGKPLYALDTRHAVHQGLTVKGLSVNDRLRQLRYLSTSFAPH